MHKDDWVSVLRQVQTRMLRIVDVMSTSPEQREAGRSMVMEEIEAKIGGNYERADSIYDGAQDRTPIIISE